MQLVTDNILWRQSYSDFKTSMLDRIHRVERSLAALKNQDGLFAEEHRRLLAMYHDVLKVILDHEHKTET